MRSFVPAYDLKTPATLDEALALIASEPGVWRPFAGGTDIMVLFEAGKLEHRKFINIWGLPELKGIDTADGAVTLGALTTYTQVQKCATMQMEFPMLCEAGRETGAVAIQNRGTLGGNIVNASPAADSPPALLAYDAEVELASRTGRRWVRYSEFHTGYKKAVIRPEELLTRIRLGRDTKRLTHYYRKVGTRKAQAISKVCFAAVGRLEGGVVRDVRIGLGSVAPVPLRCRDTEAALNGKKMTAALVAQAKAVLAREITPIDDIRSSRAYRTRVAANLIEEFLDNVCGTGSAN